MIHSKDLRIGNLVWCPFEDAPMRVEASDLIAMVQCEVAGKEIEFLKSIPLTDEWLIKSGFEPNGVYRSMRLPISNLPHYGTRSFIVVAHDGETWIELIDRNKHNQFTELQSRSFMYRSVHQLQNLYFALTGTELTINEKAQTD